MDIDEGSITYSVSHFIPEILCESNRIDSRFESFNESFLRTGRPPNSGDPFEFTNIDNFDGGWEFWTELRSYETRGNFIFQPRFAGLDIALELSSDFQSRYDVMDYKITPRYSITHLDCSLSGSGFISHSRILYRPQDLLISKTNYPKTLKCGVGTSGPTHILIGIPTHSILHAHCWNKLYQPYSRLRFLIIIGGAWVNSIPI